MGLGDLEPEREAALGLAEHAAQVVALDVLAVGRAGVLPVAAASIPRGIPALRSRLYPYHPLPRLYSPPSSM